MGPAGAILLSMTRRSQQFIARYLALHSTKAANRTLNRNTGESLRFPLLQKSFLSGLQSASFVIMVRKLIFSVYFQI